MRERERDMEREIGREREKKRERERKRKREIESTYYIGLLRRSSYLSLFIHVK